MTDKGATIQIYRIVIKATAQAIWGAITNPEWTERYAYGGRALYDLKVDGRFSYKASAEMKSFGLPDEIIVGKVIESDPPRKLVQTWHPLFDAGTTAEAHTRLTYEITENQGGVCTVTITHDVAGAPKVAGMVAGGGDPVKGGGGWPWVLSDLKSLLETGTRM
ncbi:MAG: transcriptional regulator [Hyphomicrobium sp.]|nr:transcriptional regulator [Hyphomicrobium sp.]